MSDRDYYLATAIQMLKKLKKIAPTSLAVIVAILSFQAASHSSFGVLGFTLQDSRWFYPVALFIIFSATAIALAASIWTRKQPSLSQTMQTISAASSGAWLGFYYGGIVSGVRNPELAIAGAVIGALVMAITSFYLRNKLTTIAIAVMAIVATYSLAFLCSSAAFAFLSTNNFWWGGCWGILCVLSIYLTVVFIDLLMLEIIRYRS